MAYSQHLYGRDDIMKIAILGTRGVPARYGGFETFAEELSKRLVRRGHSVTVFGRTAWNSPKSPTQHGKVEVRYSRTVFCKYAETPLASLMSMISLRPREFDAVILCNAANSPFAFIINWKKIPLFINVDGIERRRSKWNIFGKLWYMLGERASCWFADKVIADAHAIEDYYVKSFNVHPVVIAYGAKAVSGENSDVLARFGLKSKNYILYVSRLEPENNALGVVTAYTRLKTDVPLVVVGDAPYSDSYKQTLRSVADSRVIFTGYQFGDSYHALQANCLCYVQATEVGGTHPALIEAMSHGNAIVANGTPENLEVLGGAGLYYLRNDFFSLSEKLMQLLESEVLREEYGDLAYKRSKELYSWDAITQAYENLCKNYIGQTIEYVEVA